MEHPNEAKSKKTKKKSKLNSLYHTSQLSPSGHAAIPEPLVKRTAAKSQAKINYRRWTEIHSRYYELSQKRTLN